MYAIEEGMKNINDEVVDTYSMTITDHGTEL